MFLTLQVSLCSEQLAESSLDKLLKDEGSQSTSAMQDEEFVEELVHRSDMRIGVILSTAQVLVCPLPNSFLILIVLTRFATCGAYWWPASGEWHKRWRLAPWKRRLLQFICWCAKDCCINLETECWAEEEKQQFVEVFSISRKNRVWELCMLFCSLYDLF